MAVTFYCKTHGRFGLAEAFPAASLREVAEMSFTLMSAPCPRCGTISPACGKTQTKEDVNE